MGFYKTEYHSETDAHCDETRVRKIWSARDAENHTASLEHLERFKIEGERLNKARDDMAEKSRLEIFEILQESDEWLELADRLLQAKISNLLRIVIIQVEHCIYDCDSMHM